MSLRFGITLPSYHRVCFISDDVGSKRRVITTRPGHVNGVSKTPLSFWGDKRYTDLKSRSRFFSVTLGSVHLFIKVTN